MINSFCIDRPEGDNEPRKVSAKSLPRFWRLRFSRWILRKFFGDTGSISWSYDWNRKYSKDEACALTDKAIGAKSNIEQDYLLQQRERETARKFINNIPKYKPKN